VAFAFMACGRAAEVAPAATSPRLGVLSPSAAEILAALGAADRVVAVGDWVTWPPEMAARPALGSFEAPSAERVLALGIDTVISVESAAGRRELGELEKLGLRVVTLDTSTLAGTLSSITVLGDLVDRRASAAELVDSIEQRLEAIRRRAATVPRRRVLAVVGREPLFVAGPGSHFDELVRLAGGENVAADLGAPYAEMSLEAVLERRPEVILDVSENLRDAPRGTQLGDWERWTFLPAVADHRVYFVDPSRLSVPGPRLPEMAGLVAKLVQPELFGAPQPDDFVALGGGKPESRR